jgi:hypothetical protein
MSGWDDPTGWPWYAVGLCDRCHRRFPLHELIEDGNLPGLRVCREDWDELDPYRLPARQTENISLPFVRPDVSIAVPVTVAERFVRVTMDGNPRITISDETRVTGVPLPPFWPP